MAFAGEAYDVPGPLLRFKLYRPCARFYRDSKEAQADVKITADAVRSHAASVDATTLAPMRNRHEAQLFIGMFSRFTALALLDFPVESEQLIKLLAPGSPSVALWSA